MKMMVTKVNSWLTPRAISEKLTTTLIERLTGEVRLVGVSASTLT
jgi:hypothetical protein